MQGEHIRRATTQNARAGIFWHFESASVPIKQIESFAEEVKSHMKGFESKTFTAVATKAYVEGNPDLTESMHHANIDLIIVLNDGRAVQKLQNKMRDFYDDYCKDGSWMVLITGSYEFHSTIDHYKHSKCFLDLVLVHNPVVHVTEELKNEEKEKSARLAKLAPKITPLRYYLDLIKSRKEELELPVLQQESNSHAFDPTDVGVDTC